MKPRIYSYSKCSTCRKAHKFLEKKGILFEERDIISHPPSKRELSLALSQIGGQVQRLFNTSGQLYREMNMKEQLRNLSDSEAVALLSTHGKLVKRPLLFAENGILEWSPKIMARSDVGFGDHSTP